MSTAAYKRLTVILLLTTVLSIAGAARLGWKWSRDKVDIGAALRVMSEYDKTRNRLNKMAVDETISYLELVEHTSLAAQNKSVTTILERERARMIRDVVGSLRTKTGEDLGESPDKWIQKYGAKRIP